MPKKPKKYKKLPGRKTNFLMGYTTLWLGPDHLLLIDSKRFSEDYKRFYYGDIQAVIARKTAAGKIQNLFLALFAAFFAFLAYSIGKNGYVFMGIVAGTFLLALFINSLRGPTCACHIQTAVQTEKLPSLDRFRYIRKTMKRLAPLIEKAQGSLNLEALLEEDSSRESRTENTPSGTIEATRKQDHITGGVHRILFSLLLCGGLITGIDMFLTGVAITLLQTVISMAAGVFVIMGLVKQYQAHASYAVRTVTWTTLGYLAVDFFLSYVTYFVIVIRSPKIRNNQWELLKALSELSPLESPWLMGLYIFSIAGCLILGSSGLYLLQKSRQGFEFRSK